MRYYVHAPTNGVPYLGSVMTPPMNGAAIAWQSRGQVTGSPGIRAIPAPVPGGIPQSGPRRDGAGDSRSSDSPPYWFPSVYYYGGNRDEKYPVSINSDNQLPMPALRAPNVIVANPLRTRKGGQRQVRQPQVVQTWRGMYG